MSAQEAASAFFEKAKAMAIDAVREAVKELPEEVRKLFWGMRKATNFTPDKEVPDARKEILSPSGKYKLALAYFGTGKGTWNYSQGTVYRLGSDDPIAVVQRNYSSFPATWVEDHPSGHSFLVCGADYQGQTVIELDTGKRRDHLSDGTDKGFGFCWVQHRFVAASQILVVCGCHWACPYEYRFFDFSDPMSGWSELVADSDTYDDEKWPEFMADGTIRVFDTSRPDDDDDDEEEGAPEKVKPPPTEKAIKTFRREGLKLLLVNEWVSEAEKERRIRNEEAERRYEEWTKNFKATDPLYLEYQRQMKDPALSTADYESVGWTYDGWGPEGYTGKERRWCRRIVTGDKVLHVSKPKTGQTYTVDLGWGVEAGPIKLDVFKDGKTLEAKFFEHSVDGMKQAFAYTKSLIGAMP